MHIRRIRKMQVDALRCFHKQIIHFALKFTNTLKINNWVPEY